MGHNYFVTSGNQNTSCRLFKEWSVLLPFKKKQNTHCQWYFMWLNTALSVCMFCFKEGLGTGAEKNKEFKANPQKMVPLDATGI